jgi:hypothetical protein
MESPKRNDDTQRRLKWRHWGVALAKALWSTALFGVVIFVAAWVMGTSFQIMISQNRFFFLVVFFGTLLGHYHWLNYKAGIGPKVRDPNLNDGP